VWWTETKQKKKQNQKKSKDEFKIFHKLCSSQVKENLQYSQDFVASTVFWINYHSCEKESTTTNNLISNTY